MPITDEKALESEPWNLQNYDVVILTDCDDATAKAVDHFCRKRGIKFISSDCYGAFSRVFNDFGDQFEILDKNGEELQDVVIQKISNDEEGVVELH